MPNDWPDVRVVAAEALAWLGDAPAALHVLTEVIQTGNPHEALAAQNAIDFLREAGHISLEEARDSMSGRTFSEPADRIPNYLLNLSE